MTSIVLASQQLNYRQHFHLVLLFNPHSTPIPTCYPGPLSLAYVLRAGAAVTTVIRGARIDIPPRVVLTRLADLPVGTSLTYIWGLSEMEAASGTAALGDWTPRLVHPGGLSQTNVSP